MTAPTTANNGFRFWVVMAVALAIAVLASGCSRAQESGRDKAPDFEIRLYDVNSGVHNRKLRLSDLNGQVVVLNFWATWCAPCRAEMPILDAAHAEMFDKAARAAVVGVDMGISPDPPDSATIKFLKEVNVSYPIGHPGEHNVGIDYGVTALPATLLIDQEGFIAKRWLGLITLEELMQAVDELLEGQALSS
ncbi:TlpA family protein disulfide reductase [bacterium AH-315-D21]|nr:TlpA family protein disulfide reductase [bacterium AH-315-D21]